MGADGGGDRDDDATIADTPRSRATADGLARLPPRFTVKQTLGEGGMGAVVEAHDRVLSRDVAIKILARDQRADPHTGTRFLREARAAAQLKHPGIVAVYDIDPEGGFIVMELVKGESLSARLWRDKKLAADEVRRIGSALLAALAAAHHAGIVHRDVKPANLLLGQDGEVKLADFGVAYFGDSELTIPGTRVGTPAYMAPEQLRGKDVDARADVYSAGVTLFESATGERPDDDREGYDPYAQLIAATGDGVLSEAIRRAIRPRAADRFADGAAFLAALEATDVPGMPPAARVEPGRRAPRGASLMMRMPASRAPWLVAAAIAVAAIGYASWRELGSRGDDAPRPQAIAAGSAAGSGAGAGSAGSAAVAHPRTVALLPFLDRTKNPRLDFAGAGLPNLLGMELHGVPDLRVVGYYQLLGVVGTAAPSDAWLAAAKQLGADVVVHGEITGTGTDVHLALRVDSIAGARLDAIDRDVAVEKLPDAVRAAAPAVAKAAIGRAVALDPRAQSFDAERELQLGIAAVDREHMPEAIEHLQASLHRAPDLAMAHYYLAVALSWSVPPAEPALAEIDKALASGKLDDAQKGVLAGLRHIAILDYPGCVSEMTPLAKKFPAERDIHYVLFECLFHGGHPADAVVVYHHIHDLAPKFRLALIHVLTYAISHDDEANMKWALELDEPTGETYNPIWEPQILLAHRDFAGAIALMSKRAENSHDQRDVQGQLVVAYALSNQLELASTLAHELLESNVNSSAPLMLGIAMARGDAAGIASWLDTSQRAIALQPAGATKALALSLLVGAIAPIATTDQLRALDAAIAGAMVPTYERALNPQLGLVLAAAGLGDAKRLDALAASPYPEVAELATAAIARRRGDRAAAAAAMRSSIAATGDGRFLVDQWWLLAGDLRAQHDHAGTIAACDEVIRPRLMLTWAWGAAVGDCLAWTGEAAEALGKPDVARDAWRRLAATRTLAPASDPLVAEATAKLADR
jgi:TolB-like protein|nr:serine/threonine-protein kinase [Kofleriaceae bacterium]